MEIARNSMGSRAEKNLELREKGGQTSCPRRKTKNWNFPKTVDKQTVDKRPGRTRYWNFAKTVDKLPARSWDRLPRSRQGLRRRTALAWGEVTNDGRRGGNALDALSTAQENTG
jgi:hypothetical protein